jgi:glycosyltransferase involved in cell wall biosynthesis
MTQPTRILHLISRLDGYSGARMLRRLAVSQATAGARVAVAAIAAADSIAGELHDHGVEVQAIGGRWPIDPVAIARLARLQRTSQVEIVHAWDNATLIQASLSRRGSSQRLIVTLDVAQMKRRWAPTAIRSFARRVDALIAADTPTAAWLKRLGVSPDRRHTIPAGVPHAGPPIGAHSDWLVRLSLPPDSKVIAVAGPLVRKRAIDESIWCFELVRIIHPSARLLILGDGPDRGRLERFAEAVSEPGCVSFLGYRSDIDDLLPHVDIFWQLNASLATPLSLLEAQAAGVPAVASDMPAHRAAISPDRTGLLVPLGGRAEVARATDDLLGNPERAKRLGIAAAAQVAERWSLDAAILSYERLYERLYSSPRH